MNILKHVRRREWWNTGFKSLKLNSFFFFPFVQLLVFLSNFKRWYLPLFHFLCSSFNLLEQSRSQLVSLLELTRWQLFEVSAVFFFFLIYVYQLLFPFLLWVSDVFPFEIDKIKTFLGFCHHPYFFLICVFGLLLKPLLFILYLYWQILQEVLPLCYLLFEFENYD